MIWGMGEYLPTSWSFPAIASFGKWSWVDRQWEMSESGVPDVRRPCEVRTERY